MRVIFTGRKINAVGQCYRYIVNYEGDKAGLLAALYQKYEHITEISVDGEWHKMEWLQYDESKAGTITEYCESWNLNYKG